MFDQNEDFAILVENKLSPKVQSLSSETNIKKR
jgi:hypothetical protein